MSEPSSSNIKMNSPVPAATTDSGLSGFGDEQRPFPLRLILSGFILLSLFVGSLVLWSSLAPIEGAVVSPGIVSVASFRKQIQHLEGGIVKVIAVKDGDKVVAGQLLVKLQDVKSVSALRQLEAEHVEVQSIISRLLAERGNITEIVFPAELMQQADRPDVQSVMTGQVSILESHRSLLKDQHAVVENKIAQTQQGIKGLQGQIKAKKLQRKLILEESQAIEEAYKKQLVPKTESLKLKQRLAETEGELISFRTDIGRLEQSVLELRLQKSEASAQRFTEISEQLGEQRSKMFDLSQKLIAARDVHDRTKVVSPIDGIVVNLQIHSNYGVIKAGQQLMEVVPDDDELVVEAYINPEDIDEVWMGMPADVRLTSLSRRKRLPMEGEVSNISADRLTNPNTGKDYYRARIVFSRDVLKSTDTNLVAGMGAEVFLRTGARTPIDYLLAPITNSLQLGLREK